MKPLLTYCALPSRLHDLTDDSYQFVISQGHAPLHPFKALPQGKDFGDNGRFGRDFALKFAFRMVGICDQFYLFGMSDGTVQEAEKALELKLPINLHVERFDPDWRRYYPQLRDKYPFLEGLIRNNNLTV